MTLGETALFSQPRALQETEPFSSEGRSGWLITASMAVATCRVIGKLTHTKAYSKVINKWKVLVVNSNYIYI